MGKRAGRKSKSKEGKEGRILGLSKGVWMALLLAFIMGGSMIGYVALRVANPETQEPLNYVQAVVSTQNNQVAEVVELRGDVTALDAFSEIANVTLQQMQWSVEPYTVEFANVTVTQNSTHAWFFYINGRYASQDIDKLEVRHGDVIELRFEPLS